MASSSSYFSGNKRGNHKSPRRKQPVSRRSGGKQNTSKLNIFKKSDGPRKSSQNRITDYTIKVQNNWERDPNTRGTDGSDSLFFEEEEGKGNDSNHNEKEPPSLTRARSATPFDLWGNPEVEEASGHASDKSMYNENGNSGQKRRKVDNSGSEGTTALVSEVSETCSGDVPETIPTTSKGSYSTARLSSMKRIGPFLDESDSEEGSHCSSNKDSSLRSRTHTPVQELGYERDLLTDSSNEFPTRPMRNSLTMTAVDDPFISEDIDSYEQRKGRDYDDRTSRKCNEPQELFDKACSIEPTGISKDDALPGIDFAVCPICGESLAGISDNEASLHVNNCLDGNPTPTPTDEPVVVVESKRGTSIATLKKAAIPRPGQRNPFTMEFIEKETSAFSKIMSGNAEDSAWAAAAAKEDASRGKQAYERTCPFYKILPGLSVCVDAFRYGAVEGCSAYFLSHFHSDHYMGLTSSWCHGRIYCSKITGNLVRQQLKVDPEWITDIEWDEVFEIPETGGVQVTMLPANHCPGSSLFLFEKEVGKGPKPKIHRILHCGDFRASPAHVRHPLLRPDVVDSLTGKTKQQTIDVCYLDTTYLNPKYAFPNQEDVITACANVCANLDSNENKDVGQATHGPKTTAMKTMVDFLSKNPESQTQPGHQRSKSADRLLVVVGTYSIGKERLCIAIARALNCKIYAPAAKQRICACLEDEELSGLLTSNPIEAQIHMQALMEVRAETLRDYLLSFRPHFSRVVGFQPTGWNYRPPAGRTTDSPPVSSVLYSDSWQSRFNARDLIPQRGSNPESTCYMVPYSEHSSFRELTMFCCALRIGRVIPTVNVGSKKSRDRMKRWVEKWEAEKRKNGLFKVDDEATRCDGIFMIYQLPLRLHSLIYGLCTSADEVGGTKLWTVRIKTMDPSDPDAIPIIYGHGNGFLKSEYYDAFVSIGRGLFNTRDRAEHTRKRKTVSHTFSARSIGQFEQYIHANLEQFVRQWDRLSNLQRNPKTGYASIDALHWFNYLALDIIGDLAFGAPFGMLEKGRDVAEVRKSSDCPPTYASAIQVLNRRGEVSAILGIFPDLKPWAKFLPDRFFRDGLEAVEELAGIAVALVSERLRPEVMENNTRVDLLARLMEGRDENGAKLGREELTAEALTQLIAGSDTTSNTACAMLYWVLTTRGVKEKLQQTLDEVIPAVVEVPSYAMVKDIEYASSLGLPRLIPEGAPPVKIHNHVFYPGTVLSVPAYTIHHSTTIWGPDVDQFVPTRWDPSRLTSRQKAAFIPFSTGPRACVGRNVAEMELQCMAATVFKNFDLEVRQDGPLETREGFSRKLLELHVGLKRRRP
ncbi:benzoate 4-monooxygenase [Paracoccidioides brasiliensis Pb03]|nr:benzoate 4-monooxygenase [Paracoccidioides brasiliensis Pb03]